MQAFVIGGYWRFVLQTLVPFLTEYGLVVDEKHHVPTDRGFDGPIPAGVEVVLVLSEMIAGSARSTSLAKRLAAERGIPCIIGNRHKTHMRPLIESHGFKRVLSPVAAQTLAKEEAILSKPAPTPAPPDIDGMNFEQLLSHFRIVVRVMRDRHGVQELMWSPSTGVDLKRVVSETRRVDIDP